MYRILISLILALTMAAPVVPAWSSGDSGQKAAPRAVTDNASDLIVPAGETYELYGCHTYINSVRIDGTLNVKPYDGVDDTTGTIIIKAGSIVINSTGKIMADGRGFGGGGGGQSDKASAPGGMGGTGGMGGFGAASTDAKTGGGGGGGSKGGKGGAGYSVGADGTDLAGGTGGSSPSCKGGLGGAGFGSGGGGGGSDSISGGGGGGGGSSGTSAPSATGGKGNGLFGGIAGPATTTICAVAQNGADGGYLALAGNGDATTDIGVVRGGGGGGGGASTAYGGGAAGGGAGGGTLTLISNGELTILGTISSTGGSGGKGGTWSNLIPIPDLNAQDGLAPGRAPPQPVPTSNTGGSGGGGAGGGIALLGDIITISGTVNALGKQQNVASSRNGGTIKLFPNELKINGTLAAGRNYTNGRPVLKGLVSPANNSFCNAITEMSWNAAEDPETEGIEYQILVATSNDFSSAVINRQDLTKTKFNPSSAIPDGVYFWKVRAEDGFGPGRWSPVWTFTIDSTAPVSAVKSLPEFTTKPDFQVVWIGTDNCAGISDYTISMSDNGGDYKVWKESTSDNSALFNGVDGSTYRFYSVARDKAINLEEAPGVPDAITTVDATPPVSSMNPLAPYQSSEDFTVGWSGKDQTSGVASYTVYVSEDRAAFSVWQDGVTSISAVYSGQDGHEYKFYVLAKDLAGLSQPQPASGAEKAVVTKVDLNVPITVLTLNGPQFGQGPVYVTPTTRLEITATDTGSGVNVTQYVLDGGVAQKYSSALKVDTAGDHNMTYWSADRAGNRETDQTLWFFVDGQAPYAELQMEGPSFTKNGRMYITPQTKIMLVAHDNGSGVARIEYSLDSANFLEYTKPISMDKGGNHALKYRSIDNLGTRETERTLVMEVDIIAPKTTASETDETEEGTLAITLKSEDSQSGVQATHYRVMKGTDVSQDWTAGSEAIIAAPVDHSGDGKYKLEYYAVDNVGNREVAKSMDITVDTIVELTVDQAEKVTVNKATYTFEGKAEKGSKVTVNGDQVQLGPNGEFSIELPLHEGANPIEVTVTDKAGNTKTSTYLVTYKESAAANGILLPLIGVGVLVAIAALAGFLAFRRKNDKSPAGAAPARKAPVKKAVRKK
jgi:hypothetical protein